MNITIKDVPKPLHQRLKKASVQSGRSLNKYVIHVLERNVNCVREDDTALVERINRRREAMPFSLDLETMQRYIDEGRE